MSFSLKKVQLSLFLALLENHCLIKCFSNQAVVDQFLKTVFGTERFECMPQDRGILGKHLTWHNIFITVFRPVALQLAMMTTVSWFLPELRRQSL